MTLKLRASSSPDPASPFSWDKVPSSPQPAEEPSGQATPSSPPTQWLSARDMKVFGASPLSSTVGIVKCKDCEKPVLRSAMAEHAGELDESSYCLQPLSRGRAMPKDSECGKEGRKGEGRTRWCVSKTWRLQLLLICASERKEA